MSLSVLYGRSLCYQITPFVREHELGEDRAVIIHCVCPGRYIEFLYFSVKRQHWYKGVPLQRQLVLLYTRSCYKTTKWRDVLEREQFTFGNVAISVSEVHCVQNGEFIARYC